MSLEGNQCSSDVIVAHKSRRTEHGSGVRSYLPSRRTTATSRPASPGFRVYAHSAPRVACRRGLSAGSPIASRYAALNRCLFGSLYATAAQVCDHWHRLPQGNWGLGRANLQRGFGTDDLEANDLARQQLVKSPNQSQPR